MADVRLVVPLGDRLFRWYPVFLLLGLVGLTYWLDQKVQPPPLPRDGSTRHDPDVIIDNFSAMRMNPDGSQRYALEGRKLTHFPDDSSTRIDSPRFVHFDPKTAPVRVTSKEALVSRDGKEVDFTGQVHIVRDPYGDQDAMSLDTEFLHVVPDLDRATTDKPVTMVQGDTRVTAVGMEFDNRARTLKLPSKVNVVYASPLKLPTSGRN